jgi:DNA polymerase (family 10)
MPQTLPRNGELADQLDLLADLSEILDEESFKVIAYRRAAGRIRESAVPIAELALAGRAKELPGIGKTIESKVVEVVEDGEMHALTKRAVSCPPVSWTFSGSRGSVRRRRRASGRSSGSRRSTG